MSKQYRNHHFDTPPQPLRHAPPKPKTPPPRPPAPTKPTAPPVQNNPPFVLEGKLIDKGNAILAIWQATNPTWSQWILRIWLIIRHDPARQKMLLWERYMFLEDIMVEVTPPGTAGTLVTFQKIANIEAGVPHPENIRLEVQPWTDPPTGPVMTGTMLTD